MHQTAKVGRALAALAIGIGVAAFPGVSRGDDPSPDTAAVQVVTATGNVRKIDKNNRVVTLKGAQGNTLDVKVGPNVNLDKLKVGDKVNAAYYEEVAIALHKPGAPPPKMTQTVTERGGVTAQQTTVTAKIVSVDTGMNTVMMRGPNGGVHKLEVTDPDLQGQLGKIKAGDSVDVTYTQAVAVSIEPKK
jgi:Cu/Ag efflux protein CusF